MTTLETKKYDVDPFSSLHIGGPGKVYLRQGDQPELTIEAPENVFEALEVTNEAGKLSIRLRPSNFFRWVFGGGKLNIKDEITYRITVTKIEKLSFGGSLNIESKEISSPNLKISNSGSVRAEFGTLSIQEKLKVSNSGSVHALFDSVEAREFEFSSSGSVKAEFGDIHTEKIHAHASGSMKFVARGGQAAHQDVSISGSGSYEALNIESQTSSISISGSGKASVWAEEKLSLSISGSGRVQYKGNAAVNQRVSGSGHIQKIDLEAED